MKKALIIGCGYTGTALARLLDVRGIPVTGTSTSGAPVAPVMMRPLDLLDRDHPLELAAARGAVVYYMVATLYRRYDGRARPHLAAMRRCLAALQPEEIQGLVYLSSTSVYGDRHGDWVDELTPPTPQSPWGTMRAELEELVWEFGRTASVPACVVRIPEIYGPGRGPIARLRRGYSLAFPDRYSNRIHVDDLAQVLAELGRRLEPELLLVSDGHPATAREVYEFAAQQLGLPPPPLAQPPANADPNRLALLRESKRCRADRLARWLGAPLCYPSYRDGIAAILAAERGGAQPVG